MSAPRTNPDEAQALSKQVMPLVDASKFARLKKYSIMCYAPVNPDAAKLVIWGSFDTLLEAVNRFNGLTEYEQKRAYIMKNVIWRIEASEVDAEGTDLLSLDSDTNTRQAEAQGESQTDREANDGN